MLSIKVLEHCIRTDLDKKAPRTLAVIDPIKVTLINLKDDHVEEFEIPIFPKNKELGVKKASLTKSIFIERTDFKEKDDPDFFGLTLNQPVGLKYGGYITVNEVKKDNSGNVTELICEYSSEIKKLKGRIHWISQKDATRVEVRLYDYLWTVEDPMSLKEPLEELNPNSLIIKDQALVNKNILSGLKHLDHFQFERLGYFVVDYDTDVTSQKYVFNLTIDMGDEKNKKF
jgi:glutaminyl-tRNA synthetase